MTSEIVVVPHTHWDREWYEPHDVFRLRLVHMLDRLIDLLEAQTAYRFTLDGQAAAIDDYLQMRPEQRARVIKLVERGQLSIGPFLILLDEFGCDGETIVRNLELGRTASAKLGQPMPVGYLPDMFGHAAQMPQILRGFGIAHSALWRGVPADVRKHAFAWAAPSGDVVRCEYLFDGYGNGLDMFAVPGQLDALAPDYARRSAEWYGDDAVLAMLGTDHSAPPENLVEVVDEYNAASRRPAIRIATLDEYVAGVPVDADSLAELPRVVGEMRSHARGNLLPGVFSIRTNIKHEMARSERALDAAERLDLLYGSRDHRAFFDTAWYRLVESTAHDSVTGCGVDATAEQVSTRISTAGHIARGVIDTVMKDLAAAVPSDRHLVFNPSGQARRTQVELTLHAPDEAGLGAGVQLGAEFPTLLGDEMMTSTELPKLLRRIHGRELFGQQINGYEWGESSLRFSVAESPVGSWDLATFTVELEQRIAADPSGVRSWHVETIADARRRALVSVDIDGFGLASVSEKDAPAPEHAVTLRDGVMANGQLTVSVNVDGTVRIESAVGSVIDGALALVSDGDCGDSYNYGPVPGSSVNMPTSVEVEEMEAGPIRGRIRIRRTYDLPVGLIATGARSGETAPFVVDTVVELREGEPMVRVAVDYVNNVADHRLRILVPVDGTDLSSSRSAGQYAITERGREGEGGWGEFPLPTFPAYRFAAAGSTAVLTRKLTEYELVSTPGAPDALAITLSRSVGMMSVNLHPLRDEPAGSEIPVPGAQYLGVAVHTDLAIMIGAGDAAVVRAADLFRHDVLLARGTGDVVHDLPAPSVPLIIDGDVMVETVRAVDGFAEVRLVNYLSEPREIGLRSTTTWACTDFTGAVVADQTAVAGAAQIVTLRTPLDGAGR